MRLILVISAAAVLLYNMPTGKYPEKTPASCIQTETLNEGSLFSFGVLADVQYADLAPLGERYYRSSLEKLGEAMETFRRDSVDFIVNLGDLIESGYESYKPVLSILNSSSIKCYHLTGNHDYLVDPRYVGRLPVMQEAREGYYSLIYNNYRMIFLNGNEISTYAATSRTQLRQAEEYLSELKKNGAVNAVEWNGGISKEQIGWFTGQLDESVSAGEKVIILCHFPVAPENIHNLLNYSELNTIISKYQNIVAWFSGHNHAGNYCYLNKINFVTFKGMVETRRKNSFAIVDVYNNRIAIKGFGRQESMVLAF
jgi:predicted MPP superfamily phosphohydrolase